MSNEKKEPFGYVVKDTRGSYWFYKKSPYLDNAQECTTVYDHELSGVLKQECDDVDAILKHLGLDPEQYRTDGGSLNVPRIKTLLVGVGIASLTNAREDPNRKLDAMPDNRPTPSLEAIKELFVKSDAGPNPYFRCKKCGELTAGLYDYLAEHWKKHQ